MQWFTHTLRSYPEIAIFLTLAVGFFIGGLKFGKFSLGTSRCFIRLPFPGLEGTAWRLQDLLGDACYERDGTDLRARGLYLNVTAWQHHAFRMSPI